MRKVLYSYTDTTRRKLLLLAIFLFQLAELLRKIIMLTIVGGKIFFSDKE